ncbi:MAG: bifunctional riboflavin kinase/FAD synthetase [Armatimonadota bacterium]
MEIIRDIRELNIDGCSVVTIGVFDGVHIGHQEIMRLVVESAQESCCKSIAVTFDRNPEELVLKDDSVPHISTLSQKLNLLQEQGIDITVVLPLNIETLSQSADEFVRDVIYRRLSAVKVVVGTDFSFGKGRSGNVALLQKIGSELGFDVRAVLPVMSDDIVVSSTVIRKMILDGNIVSANRCLGHPFIFEGTVVHGQKIGRTIGFPTANIMPLEKQVVPAKGIYSVTVFYDGRELLGVSNIGTRPTVDGKSTEVEVHILDLADDMYGAKLDIAFHHRLRSEIKFANLDDLVKQIRCDIEQTRRLMSK